MNQNSVIMKRSNVKDPFFTLIVTPVVCAYFVSSWKRGLGGGGQQRATGQPKAVSNKQTPQ